MPIITLTLPNPINISLQVKPADIDLNTLNQDKGAWDIIYFTRINLITGKQVGEVYRLGECVGITKGGGDLYTIEVNVGDNVQTPTAGDYIFFGKDNKVGTSGVVGYFARVEMRNDSTDYVEVFAVNSQVTVSSEGSQVPTPR